MPRQMRGAEKYESEAYYTVYTAAKMRENRVLGVIYPKQGSNNMSRGEGV